MWPFPVLCACRLVGFNPHTHAGCDIHRPRDVLITVSFNPHTHAGCDVSFPERTASRRAFQSTHPRRVWLRTPQSPSTYRMFQSTHPRRVWHQLVIPTLFSQTVSIHTPTQGVTIEDHHRWYDYQVSIHTPTQGVTIDCISAIGTLEFQSTHPRRVWLGEQRFIINPYSVSIHTPTQGVTDEEREPIEIDEFQSTHPRRVWHMLARNEKQIRDVSIHTPTQGVTPLNKALLISHICFNPHTHAGCDTILVNVWKGNPLFQSTHPRRVWPNAAMTRNRMEKFQSTHPRRVWRWCRRFYPVLFWFQSTHPRRVWPRVSGKAMYITIRFQSTHPRRVWLCGTGDGITGRKFQSTHPRRVWPSKGDTGTPGAPGFNPHTHAGCDINKNVFGSVLMFQSTHPRRVWLPAIDALNAKKKVSIHTPTQGVTDSTG